MLTLEQLRAHPAADRVELSGSTRRMADSVKDLDVIATASDPEALAALLRYNCCKVRKRRATGWRSSERC